MSTTTFDIASLPNPRPLTPKDHEIISTWFRKNEGKFANSANFMLLHDDGKVTEYLNRPCHSDVDHRQTFKDVKAVATTLSPNLAANWSALTHSYSANKSWDLVKPFLKYLVQDSYMASFIEGDRDVDKAIADGFIVVSSNVPAILLQNIMITSRYLVETSSDSFEMFNKCLDNGIDADMAFIVCFNTTFSATSSKTTLEDRLLWPLANFPGHRSQVLHSRKGMLNYLNRTFGNVEKIKGKTYRTDSNYWGGSACFVDQSEASQMKDSFLLHALKTSESLREALSVFRRTKSSGSTLEVVNPFKTNVPPPRDPLSLNYEEIFKVVLPFISANPSVLVEEK